MASVSGVYFVGIWNGFWSGGFSPIAILFPKCLSLIALNLSYGASRTCGKQKSSTILFFFVILKKYFVSERLYVLFQARVHHDISRVQMPCARLPHHISIYPIHPLPQRSPMCARASIDWMGIIDASMSIIDAPATPWCTTRHDALSKIGPFSQIGAFQRYNRDKCTVSILPQICDVTEALSKCVIEN